jgi:Zn-dependent peptidase ImmA (M78 family)/DNA-binding XRE family transcriptional regulator
MPPGLTHSAPGHDEMPRIKALVTPALLTWARVDAGFTVDAAAKKLKIAPDRLLSWENNTDRPSLPQARKMAELYRRPLALFYLQEPPKSFQAMHDYRRLPGQVAGVMSPAMTLELRRAQERRQAAIDLAQEIEEPLQEFRQYCDKTADPETVGLKLRRAMGITIEEQAHWHSPDVAWRQLRQHAEAVGALVFLTTTYPVSEARGFSIAADVLPVVGVNRKDSSAARCFTLLHEMTHLLLREGGICDLDETNARPAAEDRIEIFCNAVAAAALVPRDDLVQNPAVAARPRITTDWTDDDLSGIASRYGCSREVVLRRLLTLQRTTKQFYQERRDSWAREAVSAAKRRPKPTKPIKRNIPTETISIVGRPFLRLAFSNYRGRRITLNDLSDLLNVQARHVIKIERRLEAA